VGERLPWIGFLVRVGSRSLPQCPPYVAPDVGKRLISKESLGGCLSRLSRDLIRGQQLAELRSGSVADGRQERLEFRNTAIHALLQACELSCKAVRIGCKIPVQLVEASSLILA